MRRCGKQLEYAANMFSFLISKMDLPNGVNHVRLSRIYIAHHTRGNMKRVVEAEDILSKMGFIEVKEDGSAWVYTLKDLKLSR